jgi:hypothetical protein
MARSHAGLFSWQFYGSAGGHGRIGSRRCGDRGRDVATDDGGSCLWLRRGFGVRFDGNDGRLMRTTSVKCPFTGEVFELFSLWQAKKLQADKMVLS